MTQPVGQADAGKATNGYDLSVAVVHLLRGLLWPGLILFIFTVMMEPVVQTIRVLPALASRTDVISFGEFKVELTERLEGVDAEPRIRAALSGLDAAGLEVLLKVDGTSHGFCGRRLLENVRPGLETLRDLGLADFDENQDADDMNTCFNVNMTDLGVDSRVFLISFIAEALK